MIDWSVLDPVARRVRVNHALEHATITILSGRVTGVVLRGRSNRRGFYVLGDVDPDDVDSAARDALARLRGGESELAIHPFCGTNVAVAGIFAGLSAAVVTRAGKRGGGYPGAVLAALIALLVSQPVGIWAQRHLTTQSDVRNLQIVGVEEKEFLGRKLHFVHTSQ
jgi:hypothetical protein